MPKGPGGQGIAEGGVRNPPLRGDERHRVRQELIVHAVEDDGQRGAEDQQLLVAGPAAFVDDRSDIHGAHGAEV